MKTIDSFRPPRRPRQPQEPAASQATGARFTKLTGKPHRKRIAWGIVAVVAASPLLFLVAALGWVGMVVTVAAGIAALVWRMPSRLIFVAALMALLYAFALQLSDARELAQPMASLTYVLLGVGAFSLAKEVKMSSRVWFKKH